MAGNSTVIGEASTVFTGDTKQLEAAARQAEQILLRSAHKIHTATAAAGYASRVIAQGPAVQQPGGGGAAAVGAMGSMLGGGGTVAGGGAAGGNAAAGAGINAGLRSIAGSARSAISGVSSVVSLAARLSGIVGVIGSGLVWLSRASEDLRREWVEIRDAAEKAGEAVAKQGKADVRAAMGIADIADAAEQLDNLATKYNDLRQVINDDENMRPAAKQGALGALYKAQVDEFRALQGRIDTLTYQGLERARQDRVKRRQQEQAEARDAQEENVRNALAGIARINEEERQQLAALDREKGTTTDPATIDAIEAQQAEVRKHAQQQREQSERDSEAQLAALREANDIARLEGVERLKAEELAALREVDEARRGLETEAERRRTNEMREEVRRRFEFERQEWRRMQDEMVQAMRDSVRSQADAFNMGNRDVVHHLDTIGGLLEVLVSASRNRR